MFEVLVWLHVLCVVVALGATVTYFPWLYRVGKSPESLVFTLRTIRFVNGWFVNPSYLLAFVLGCGLVSLAPAEEEITFSSPWIIVSLILFLVLTALGHGLFAPRLKKQTALAETAGPADPGYQSMARSTLLIGYIIAGITLAITALMFLKPKFW